jgi:hypothetical protein
LCHLSFNRLTPQSRAAIEAMPAKLAAASVCNSDDESPVVDEEPSEDAVRSDTRSQAQRNHDGSYTLLVTRPRRKR